VGKSFLASALAHSTCRSDYRVRAYRRPRRFGSQAGFGLATLRLTANKLVRTCPGTMPSAEGTSDRSTSRYRSGAHLNYFGIADDTEVITWPIEEET
jgi:hypothetical protein